MTTFDDREHAFESKFAYDAEKQFKAEARCTKLLANWAAALLGKDVEAYTSELIAADFEEAGQDDVFRKLVADLAGQADEATIRAKMAECMAEAKAQIDAG
ncbi:DUF1476 domain-containing protein [Sedimentimonas flavescens]|uniref:DUF1476 domain-containing protein n=1 Tax=Sedimentimonas flavescens TaxID=2851012 RepID=A0ABT2ZWZ6_9RHOB|nr:DUF1476 domain-containing protein [Sedimentimonas flavescens]MBW0158748.1 DUF1476 domain-containing protein [Sedimentimonas flavescens]MCT2540244.1 DUF1476 domain-containing protein [Sedimentimonas flavescens]MCV2878273.1 DUF1476 domain-containing protein [Sedimentimonas flavescens]WBL34022.1 DUF1476 domain-containing protein [Sinirhodobacter sp. HNIBRBA609]